ncbi:hypothetical protein NXV05_19850 [Parabacteroides johnsonii]|nr:hypothetical protein [Parabacteroides johnsonii]
MQHQRAENRHFGKPELPENRLLLSIVKSDPDIGNKIYRISNIKVDFIAMTTVFVTMKTVIVLNQDGHHG